MNISFLNQLRRLEIQDILEKHRELFDGKRVLEVGGGTGVQAEVLSKIANEIVSLEIAESNYSESANHHIALYDGHHIPFPDASFDVVYSSNVLEHIAHRDAFQQELARVLKPGGYAIHSMPTHWWKLRDIIETFLMLPLRILATCYKILRGKPLPEYGGPIEFIVGVRHGEFGTTLTESYHFMPRVWLGHFNRLNWRLVHNYSGGVFYTSRILLAGKLSWRARRILARFLGSSIHIYLLQHKSQHACQAIP